MIAASLPAIEDCHDCADFILVPLLWSRASMPTSSSGAGQAHRRRHARLSLLDGRKGNDVQWYFSENHALLFHTAAYLAGHILPDATLRAVGPLGASSRPSARRACAPGSIISRNGRWPSSTPRPISRST
jgi:hypothetical protein